MSQDWRTEINAEDYFGHQRKKLELADRRPGSQNTTRTLLGPGIGINAVRIVDFNDLLATFNGYYAYEYVSALVSTAASAPNTTESFIGTTVMDPDLGGRQVFTGLASSTEYTRVFLRNPSDPESIIWGAWVSDEKVPATAVSPTASGFTLLPFSTSTFLTLPAISTTGVPTYSVSGTNLNILRPGVYSGSLKVEGYGSAGYSHFSALVRRLPAGTGTVDLGEPLTPVPFVGGVSWDFLFSTTVGTQALRVAATQTQNSSGGAAAFVSHLQITRLGDA